MKEITKDDSNSSAGTGVDNSKLVEDYSVSQNGTKPNVSGSLIVSFDFDSTLSRKDVQEYAKELTQRGIDVWVVTSRYDELHKHRYPHNPTNNDLWQVIDELNIPRWKVRFTCMESKSNYLMHTKTVWHLDDDTVELYEMRYNKCQTTGISVNSGSWKQKCERYILRSLKGCH